MLQKDIQGNGESQEEEGEEPVRQRHPVQYTRPKKGMRYSKPYVAVSGQEEAETSTQSETVHEDNSPHERAL